MSIDFFIAFCASALFAMSAYYYGKWETEVRNDLNSYRHLVAAVLEESMAHEKELSEKVKSVQKVIEWLRNGVI